MSETARVTEFAESAEPPTSHAIARLERAIRVFRATLTPKGRRVLPARDRAVDEIDYTMLDRLARDRGPFVLTVDSAVRALRGGFPHG